MPKSSQNGSIRSIPRIDFVGLVGFVGGVMHLRAREHPVRVMGCVGM